MKNERSKFSGKLGYVLAAAGASVGLGNIWRFPYLAAKYGGGIFLLVYIILAVTFGYTMIIAETAIGRYTKKSPVGAFKKFGNNRFLVFGGWINAIIPALICPYYSTIGGWVTKYLYEYLRGNTAQITQDGYFTSFIAGGYEPELWFIIFLFAILFVIYFGVKNGIERVSRFMMPILLVLALLIAGYSMFLPGAIEGVKYFLIPNFKNFSFITVVSAMGQMFYSLSIAMGILITFGSYMKDDVSIDNATIHVEIFDTGIAILAGLMIIPAVFAFSGGDPSSLNAGPALMFITIPKVLASTSFARLGGILFFVLVLFAALTSAIALTESAVATIEDELGYSRKKATIIMGLFMLVLGTLSSLGYGPLGFIKIIGMQFLDFFDFITNTVMMPLAAICICFLITHYMGIDKVNEEVTKNNHSFGRMSIFEKTIKYFSPVILIIILFSSIANVFGWIKM
ncbi:MAG: sodium-dependent transporter [Sphaerochaetaceae bacterium]|nr:sodium-dependent transporter [Sphaerochaetaceae bacterium]